MERLTTTNKDVGREMICRNEDCGVTEEHCPHLMEDECYCLQDVIKKLAYYEDLEEQGLLKIFPCKVGDTVYRLIGSGRIESVEVKTIEIDDECNTRYFVEGETYAMWVSENRFGKTVFLTPGKAGEALRELEEKESLKERSNT